MLNFFIRNSRLCERIAAIVFILGISLSFPAYSYAGLTELKDEILILADIVGFAVTVLLFGLAFASFVWNLVKLMNSVNDSSKKEELKQKLVWNLIILFVLVAAWGIISKVANWLGVGVGGTSNVPILNLGQGAADTDGTVVTPGTGG